MREAQAGCPERQASSSLLEKKLAVFYSRKSLIQIPGSVDEKIMDSNSSEDDQAYKTTSVASAYDRKVPLSSHRRKKFLKKPTYHLCPPGIGMVLDKPPYICLLL